MPDLVRVAIEPHVAVTDIELRMISDPSGGAGINDELIIVAVNWRSRNH
ncbi:MAG: hypothetical protein PHS53_03660 [Candidatus Pacebacteria bacterium]|nr:hypothetical protein [Candidatus Paceibacterota bacterium]